MGAAQAAARTMGQAEATAEQVAARAMGQAGESSAIVEEAAAGMKQAAQGVRGTLESITSDTWYTWYLSERQSWIDANSKWADMLTRELTNQYYTRSRLTGMVPKPVMFTVYGSREGVSISCNSTMGMGFDAKLVREIIVQTIRGTAKAYLRSVAVGGGDLPKDFEIRCST